MNTQDFAMWLHGFFEISDSNTLSEKQVKVIKDHLDLCFSKVTPDRSDKSPSQTYCAKVEATVSPNKTAYEALAAQVTSAASGTYYPRGYFGPENSHDYYVTVSKNPNFDNARYSAYAGNCIITNSVRAGLETAGITGNFMLTIDDSLNPTGQYAKGLVGDKNMIRGLPVGERAYGMVNIGYGKAFVC